MKARKTIRLTGVILACVFGYMFVVLQIGGNEGCARISDISELQKIHMALVKFSFDHNGDLPGQLEDLYPYIQNKVSLNNFIYVPGYSMDDNGETLLLYDNRYFYHKCMDRTQVRALYTSGVVSVYGLGKKNYYKGKLRTLLFWRFLGFPYEEKIPELSEIQMAKERKDKIESAR